MVKNVDLAEREDLRERQNDWLQYPDNKCDGLLGGLPLAIGELYLKLYLELYLELCPKLFLKLFLEPYSLVPSLRSHSTQYQPL